MDLEAIYKWRRPAPEPRIKGYGLMKATPEHGPRFTIQETGERQRVGDAMSKGSLRKRLSSSRKGTDKKKDFRSKLKSSVRRSIRRAKTPRK